MEMKFCFTNENLQVFEDGHFFAKIMVIFDEEICLLSWRPCKYKKNYIDAIYLFDILERQ